MLRPPRSAPTRPVHPRALRAVSLVVAALVSATPSVGEDTLVDPAISYQALVQFQDVLLNEPADFVFTLWDAETDGKPVGKPIFLDRVDVIDGVLSVELPFEVADFETGERRWLQVEMRVTSSQGDYETLSPRSAMGATPFSLNALSGSPGPQGPPGPPGPPGETLLAGRLCPAGEAMTGVSEDGELECGSTDVCSGIVCQPHQECQVLEGPNGQDVGICVDTCQGFSCPTGSVCELRQVACFTQPCPPVAACTMMPTDPQDPCATQQCASGQECKVFDANGQLVPYCADTCQGRQCPANEVCELQPVACVTEPCPPVARCVAQPGDPGDPCANVSCEENQTCQTYQPASGGEVAFCADTCADVQCPDGERCDLVDVYCITEPCPPIAQCVPEGSRDVCELALDRGPCRALIPRWGRNPESGRCERFNWGGCGGNGNNFATLADCEKACGAPDACELQPDPGPCRAFLPRWHYDEVNGRCERFIYGGCGGNDNNFATQAACEAACRPDSAGQCELPPDKGPCLALIPRWAHDPRTGSCRSFVWGGCGGNENNYATREECERRCGVEIDECAQPADPGPCRAAIAQWYHDPDSGQCEKFTYGGCAGNENRYATRRECEQACDVDVDVCALPAENGPCRAYIPRWYNDPASGQCERFVYGGCGGNENNFRTQAECRDACGARVDICTLPSDPGPCDGVFPRWSHNPQTGQCERFIWGGCEGNANNFRTREACEQACDVAPPDACGLAPDPGPCDAYIPRWYFDSNTGACQSFVYGGCGGNGNNFTTREQCQQACIPTGNPGD